MVTVWRLSALITLLCFAGLAQAAITAQVDRTELYNDESLVLTVSVSPAGELNQADLAALASLFSIDQRAQQQSRKIVNGSASSSVDYQFRLSAKASGVIGIPSFRVGSEQSEPLFITVLDARQRPDNLPDDAILFNGRLSNSRPYVDQPFEIVLEFAYKIQVKGAIEAIDLETFSSRLVSEENTTTTRNGQTYNLYRQVVELTAKNPGAVKIPTILFKGEYADSSQGRYVRFSRSADIAPIEVRAIPASFPAGAYWLPATNLSLSDNLDTRQPIDQNSHLDWQVSLQTQGLAASRLPDPLASISASLDRHIRLYRNEPTFTDNLRLDSAALTVDTPGEYRIPAIRVPWWNTVSDTLEWAELPERSISVLAPTRTSAQTANPALAAEALAANSLVPTRGSEMLPTGSNYWLYSTVFAGLGWLFTLGLWWRQARLPGNPGGPVVPTPKAADSVNWTRAQGFAKAGDRAALYDCLIKLTRTEGEPLAVVKTRLTSATRGCLEDLERSLFSDQASPPSAAAMTALVQALRTVAEQSVSGSQPDALRLYP
ncbi:BatD family protein [Reinekea sp.]|jgi:hypothetical protein|uniref:BatD family protein n=1 Tax=Reinekea sp. TaxID=1970455 RepID=UPI002A7EF7D2|nr:BatD family protein [Reinekea sp.]